MAPTAPLEILSLLALALQPQPPESVLLELPAPFPDEVLLDDVAASVVDAPESSPPELDEALPPSVVGLPASAGAPASAGGNVAHFPLLQ